MEIDTMVPPGEISEGPASQADDPYVADLLQVADTKIAQMSQENKLLQETNIGLQEKIKHLHKQVSFIFNVFYCVFVEFLCLHVIKEKLF